MPACIGAAIGDGMRCVDEKTLRAEAERTCNSRGLKLASFNAAGACRAAGMVGFTSAKFECCK